MQIRYTCPYWGFTSSHPGLTSAEEFIQEVVAAGYDGIEIDLPADKAFEEQLLQSIKARQAVNFVFIAQQWLPRVNEAFVEYEQRYSARLEHLVSLRPAFINSHTGKDFFSFDENCRLISIAMELSAKSGVKILHETHRGRFSYHASSLLPYLAKFPEMALVADFSHWCTVSESLMEDQEEIIEKIIPHCSHIHARIGYEHSPQVNDFRAPEWANHKERFISWWKRIVEFHRVKGQDAFTICPEFGPISYMPTEPFTGRPLARQWDENMDMMKMLKEIF